MFTGLKFCPRGTEDTETITTGCFDCLREDSIEIFLVIGANIANVSTEDF